MIYQREESAGYLTNWAGRLFVRAIERRLSGGNAGPMPVFFALVDGSMLSQKELARWAAVEQPTMANTLNRMERDGLIERRPDPTDGRSALIALTSLGMERAIEAMDAGKAVNALALADLTAAERKMFFAMMHKIIDRLAADSEREVPELRVGR